MSEKSAQEWLRSQNSFESRKINDFKEKLLKRKKSPFPAKTISITSGKGGVGKTSVAVKMGKVLSELGHQVLLIDCDHNLSNTLVKLGLPLNDNFYSLITHEKRFDECIYRSENLDILSGCNGNLGLYKDNIQLSSVVIDILVQYERCYDFIILDGPAGLDKDAMTINAYSDYRVVIVTPDKSSLTDSYSLIKILNKRYGIHENHLLVNKVTSKKQYDRIVKALSGTIENFINCRLNIMGNIPRGDVPVDEFDQLLLKNSDSEIHRNFLKLSKKFTEEALGHPSSTFELSGRVYHSDDYEQDVQEPLS